MFSIGLDAECSWVTECDGGGGGVSKKKLLLLDKNPQH